jgi:hypothetical protein
VYYQCDGNADNSFDTIPSLLADAGWIATRRQSLDPAVLTFTIQAGEGADVYVMMTKPAADPAWITSAGLSRLAIAGKWRDNAMNLVDYAVYGKTFPAGASVKLGGTAVDFVVLAKAAGRTGMRAGARGITPASGYAFLSAARRIAIPPAAGDAAREIALYDLSGKCLRKAMLSGKEAFFDAGDGLAGGVHIIRIRNP